MAIHSINAVYAQASPTLLGEVSSLSLWVDGGTTGAIVPFTTTNNTFASWCVVTGTGANGVGFNSAGITIGIPEVNGRAPAISLPSNNTNQSARPTWYQMIIPPGSKIDLNDWVFKVNAANEGIMIYYGI